MFFCSERVEVIGKGNAKLGERELGERKRERSEGKVSKKEGGGSYKEGMEPWRSEPWRNGG